MIKRIVELEAKDHVVGVRDHGVVLGDVVVKGKHWGVVS